MQNCSFIKMHLKMSFVKWRPFCPGEMSLTWWLVVDALLPNKRQAISNYHVNTTAIIHYSEVIMGAMASQITSLTIVYPPVYSGADQRKHQSSAPLAFVRGIHRWPVNSPHKWPVTRKIFRFDDVIMSVILIILQYTAGLSHCSH